MGPNIKKAGLLDDYQQQESIFDEMLEAQGTIRPHWRHLIQQIHHLGTEELELRKLELQRLLREHGVTYNIYDNPEGVRQLWKLDPIPFILEQESWERIESGLRQRAKLLNLLLADLYGKRQVIKNGILPISLLYSDRNFLRPCDQSLLGQKHQLLLYAADLSRGPNGNLWVIGDRTQAPSGWSYTMENRIAMARALPELFIDNHVCKILSFFQQGRNALAQFAPQGNDDPRIVLLTPGSMNETYFEHAYLAAQQGYDLVQGRDLMVKDDCVWIKTLGGLEKVDIIIRRVDDSYCDPLALRADSHLGVAGLLEVVRAGNVRLANPLGSGILENPGLMAFMPKICRFFLNEDLLLPNLATWWCGSQKERNYVLNNLNKLVIKKIGGRSKQKTAFGWELSTQQLTELSEKIKQIPYLYVAQEQAIFSSAPSFNGQRLAPRHAVLRCFAVANSSQYNILRGGLTRSAPKAGNKHVSGQSGGTSKDTWVLSHQPVRPRFNLSRPQIPFHFKHLDDLPSSVAENLFWVGRYGIRILHVARLLRVVLRYRSEIDNFDDPNDSEIYRILLQALTHVTVTYPGFLGEEGLENLENPDKELLSIIMDNNKIGGLAHSLKMWKFGGNTIRNHWSLDTWRIFDQIEESWAQLTKKGSSSFLRIRSELDQLTYNITAFFSLTHGSMSIEEGQSLFSVGMDLEHCMQMASLLRATLAVKADQGIESGILEAVLMCNHSLTTYRHRYRHLLELNQVIDLILLDTNYPQSIAFALQRLSRELGKLPHSGQAGKLRLDQKLILKTYTDLQLVELEHLTDVKEETIILEELDKLLGSVRADLSQAANSIILNYFTHIGKEQQRALLLLDADQ